MSSNGPVQNNNSILRTLHHLETVQESRENVASHLSLTNDAIKITCPTPEYQDSAPSTRPRPSRDGEGLPFDVSKPTSGLAAAPINAAHFDRPPSPDLPTTDAHARSSSLNRSGALGGISHGSGSGSASASPSGNAAHSINSLVTAAGSALVNAGTASNSSVGGPQNNLGAAPVAGGGSTGMVFGRKSSATSAIISDNAPAILGISEMFESNASSIHGAGQAGASAAGSSSGHGSNPRQSSVARTSARLTNGTPVPPTVQANAQADDCGPLPPQVAEELVDLPSNYATMRSQRKSRFEDFLSSTGTLPKDSASINGPVILMKKKKKKRKGGPENSDDEYGNSAVNVNANASVSGGAAGLGSITYTKGNVNGKGRPGVTYYQSWYLTFADNELEDAFVKSHVWRQARMWKISIYVGLLMSVTVLLFHLLMTSDVANADARRNRELLIWGVGSAGPLILTHVALTLFIFRERAASPDHVEVHIRGNAGQALMCILIVMLGVCGVIMRHALVEPSITEFKPVVFLVFLIFTGRALLRVRFIYYFFVTLALLIAYIIQGAAAYDVAVHFWLALVVMICTVIIVNINAYDQEKKYRVQFLKTQQYRKTTTKLVDQLRKINRQYTTQAGDLESPLEKSVAIVRAVMADPSLGSDNISWLTQVLELLNSENLYMPEFQKQLAAGDKLSIDDESRAWLASNFNLNRCTTTQRPSVPSGSSAASIPSGRKFSMPAASGRLAHDRRKSIQIGGVTTARSRHKSITEGMRADVAMQGLPGRRSRDPSVTSNSAIASNAASTSSTGPGSATSVAPNLPGREHVSAPPPPLPNALSSSFTSAQKQARCGAMLDKVLDWNWDVFEFTDVSLEKPLVSLAQFLFTKGDFFTKFRLPRDKFLIFCQRIEAGYHADNPYHNAIHATDVLHGVYFLKENMNSFVPFSEIECMAMYVAAMIHDFDHPGTTNNFLINTLESRAVLYNDRSVLENHHLASAFAILLKPECNFLKDMPREDFKQFRELVIAQVLATDLSQHYETISQFRQRTVMDTFNPAAHVEDRHILMKFMLKCADVSNPTKKMNLYSQWTFRIMQEFYTQGDKEKASGLAVSPFYDRENPQVAKCQLGFIEFIVTPIYEALHGFVDISEMLETMQSNKQYWQRMREDAERDKAMREGTYMVPMAIASANSSSSAMGNAAAAAVASMQTSAGSNQLGSTGNAVSQSYHSVARSENHSMSATVRKSIPGILDVLNVFKRGQGGGGSATAADEDGV